MDDGMAEAIASGERVLTLLREAYAILDEADEWGFIDLTCSGLIADLRKRSKLKKVNQLLEQSGKELRTFDQKLRDVDGTYVLNISLDDDLMRHDVLLDDILTNRKASKDIEKCHQNVERAIAEIEKLVGNLRKSLGE